MDTKFTKGNWLLKNPIAKYAGYNNLWFCIIESEDRHIIQKIYGKTKEEAEANAKLIAAAPEMLEACMTAKAMYEAQGITPESIIGGEQYSSLLNTIKKATE